MTVHTGEYYRVALRATGSSGDFVNVWHFQTNLATDMTDTAFCTAVAGVMSTIYATLNSYIHAEVQPVDCRVDQVSWSGSPVKEHVIRPVGNTSWATAFTPSGSGDALPPGDAAMVKFRTGAVKTLGRKFLFEMTEAVRNGGGYTSPFASALSGFAAAFLADFTIGSSNFIRAGLWSLRGNAWFTLASYVIDTRVAYQRRRKERVGS